MGKVKTERQDGADLVRWESAQDNKTLFSTTRIAVGTVLLAAIVGGGYFVSQTSSLTWGETDIVNAKRSKKTDGFWGLNFFGQNAKPKYIPTKDELAWREIKHSTDVEELENFLNKHPNSDYAKFANARLHDLAPATGGADGAPIPEPKSAAAQETGGVEIKNVYEQKLDAKRAVFDATEFSSTSGRNETILGGLQLIKSLKAELKRVGCDSGQLNGRWGYAEQQALERFSRYANVRLDTNNPTQDAVDKVQQITHRVCPRIEVSSHNVR